MFYYVVSGGGWLIGRTERWVFLIVCRMLWGMITLEEEIRVKVRCSLSVRGSLSFFSLCWSNADALFLLLGLLGVLEEA